MTEDPSKGPDLDLDYSALIEDFLARYARDTIDLERLARVGALPDDRLARKKIVDLMQYLKDVGALDATYFDQLLKRFPVDDQAAPRG